MANQAASGRLWTGRRPNRYLALGVGEGFEGGKVRGVGHGMWKFGCIGSSLRLARRLRCQRCWGGSRFWGQSACLGVAR